MKEKIFKMLLRKYEKDKATNEDLMVIDTYFSLMQHQGINPETIKLQLALRNRLYRTIKKRAIKPVHYWAIVAGIVVFILVVGFAIYIVLR
ncbi:hypothetical protein [Formosa sp. A9]|uniref:hypothetical protein n=1 Tax=Formosa sp. A9 TaxID=3442641 RepID=UPI003EBA0968